MPPCSRSWAFFLDIDGTLLDIADTPDSAEVTRSEKSLVRRLHGAADGALALVSGRSLAAIDELFSPIRLAAAGQHGVERRDAQGRVHRGDYPRGPLRRAAQSIGRFAAQHPGLVFEDKGTSFSLHYRLAPALEDEACAVVRDAAAELGDWVDVMQGKMVIELKPAGRDKGVAIDEFLHEPPFAGRSPVFIGDDVTDEDGFRVVNRAGGHSIKVGSGATQARWQLPDPNAARAWLEGCVTGR